MLHIASAALPVKTVLKTVTGQWLAHSKRTKVESAFIARDLHLGNIQLILPTVGQSAWLADVSASYAHYAITCPENEQELVRAGVFSLALSARYARPNPMSTSPAAMAAELVSAVGLDVAFDLLVAAKDNAA